MRCVQCAFRPHNTRPPTTLHSPTGGVWDRKPVVGRGPRDQSSGQKPHARAPEVLPRVAPLRFERARGAKLREGGIAAFSTLIRFQGFLRGCSKGRAMRLFEFWF
jgi:hypothetical protein